MPKTVYVLEDLVSSMEDCRRGYSVNAFESEEKLFERIQEIIGENKDFKWYYKLPADFSYDLKIVGYGKYKCWHSEEKEEEVEPEESVRTLTVKAVHVWDHVEVGAKESDG